MSAAIQLRRPHDLTRICHLIPSTSINCAGTLALSGYTAVWVRRVLRPFLLKEWKEANAKSDHPIAEEVIDTLVQVVSSGLEVGAGAAMYLTIGGVLSLADYLANGTEADRMAARSRCVCVWKMNEGQQMKRE